MLPASPISSMAYGSTSPVWCYGCSGAQWQPIWRQGSYCPAASALGWLKSLQAETLPAVGCPDRLKKQMGGPTSPALFHLLQDWSSNWANVKTRRKSNHPKVVQKTSHGNKNWTHNSTTEWSFSQCFYFSTHILSFHTASQAGLLALMPHQTFNTGFPPPENLTPRSLSWSLQGKQSKLLNTKKKNSLTFSEQLSCCPNSSAEVIDASDETIILNDFYLPATRFLGFSQADYYIVIPKQASLKRWLFCRNDKDAGESINSFISQRDYKARRGCQAVIQGELRNLYSLPLYHTNQSFRHAPVVLISQKN